MQIGGRSTGNDMKINERKEKGKGNGIGSLIFKKRKGKEGRENKNGNRR